MDVGWLRAEAGWHPQRDADAR